MIISLNVEPYRIDRPTQYNILEEGELKGYPILTIDRDSYMTELKILASFQAYQGFIPYNFQVGKYTSIAPDVKVIIDSNHDYLAACQGRPREFGSVCNQNIKRAGELLIENDCWIGMGTTIMSGVFIHNGAVVAANSTVTKDVPPYAIVGGNPACVIKYRFEQTIIQKLQEIRWWNWTSEKVAEAQKELTGDIRKFIEKYDVTERNNKARIEKIRVAEQNIQYLFFVDCRWQREQLAYIVKSFCEQFEDSNHELMICYQSDEDYEYIINPILEMHKDCNVYVNIYKRIEADERELISQADFYITSSAEGNLWRVACAEEYGIEVLSGFQLPLFNG